MTAPITIIGAHDAATLQQIQDVAGRASHAALMADGHLGYIMPIGGVAAYRNQVSVAGVGFDIACGNCAIKTDRSFESLFGAPRASVANGYQVQQHRELNELADMVARSISFGVGRTNASDDAPTDHELFYDAVWTLLPNTGAQRAFRDELQEKARRQLGTVGSGNHYVDILVDQYDFLWVGVHFGSRGLGHTIASSFMALAQGQPWGTKVAEAEALLDLDTQLGRDYWALMELAGEYAHVGRDWVARKVVELLGAHPVDYVHNNHNFAWREPDAQGEPWVVVRKGATPAYPKQRGFVGGSMGDAAVILQGRNEPAALAAQTAALFSTVHGAGRVMSRTEAAGKRHRHGPKAGQLILRDDGTPKQVGKVRPQDMQAWLTERGVILRGGGLDESPQAYRRLTDVLEAHAETIEVTHVLDPVIVAMAGADEFDPYKD